jgi:hypothetical protein
MKASDASAETAIETPATDAERPYAMTIGLNVLNHLGINLYSNVPAVLAEVVANSWDADAEQVWIEIDPTAEQIVITDDGHGMDRDDVNKKFLFVGYARRDDPGKRVTPKHKRPVMGRKGIGKLSLFSVANTVEVYTVKDGNKSAFRMNSGDIRKQIEAEGTSGHGTYYPTPLPEELVAIDSGTKIVITDLKKSIATVSTHLRRRLARRFSILGEEYKFEVKVGGDPVTIEDRDYFHKIQYLWYFGDASKRYADYATKAEKKFQRDATTPGGETVAGWIGTVTEPKVLKDEDNLNRIIVMVRGKIAQEDILAEFNDGGIYTKYVFGEIHADFLDSDELNDIATSSRQRIIEDDPRYKDLKVFVSTELKNIESSWNALRRESGTKKALQSKAIKDWFEGLNTYQRKHAKSLFGRINQMTVDETAKRELFKHGVLAFESLRYKDALAELDKVDPTNLSQVVDLFVTFDDLEATLYHQIVTERVAVIEKLREVIETNALEKVVQQHLYDHLWLLDPAWERATEVLLEQNAKKEFDKLDAKLSAEEEKGRFDIKYIRTSGEHVIVELKRANRVLSTAQVLEQIDKYRSVLQKLLDASGRGHESVEAVVLVGKPLSDWASKNGRLESAETLKPKHIRVVQYDELLDQAYASYKEFIERKSEVGRVSELIRAIEDEMPDDK